MNTYKPRGLTTEQIVAQELIGHINMVLNEFDRRYACKLPLGNETKEPLRAMIVHVEEESGTKLNRYYLNE